MELASRRGERRKKFDRLVNRILEGKAIPFLGAGVSNDAEHEDGSKDIAKASEWKKKLSKAICSKIKEAAGADRRHWYAWCCDQDSCQSANEEHCSSKCSNERQPKCQTLSLGQLCETYIWLQGDNGQRDLVRKVLGIEKLAKLRPCPAHHYIAFLAREGLIEEVITTNYDACMEQAYCDTFPIPAQELHFEDPALVITDLKNYREKAGKTFILCEDKRMPCLKIYKINGCAKNLAHIREEKEDTILLTERQLQDWRERSWARDFFRDRLRSRTIVFSGFGNDEPQVRHTALQVVEEFQISNSSEVAERNESLHWWEHPNAPFIAAYDGYLTFNQIQILHAYIQAHSNYPSIEGVYLKNVFTASDRTFFGDPPCHCERGQKAKEPKLCADLFWGRVFQAVFKELLLKRYCSRFSVAVIYLSRFVAAPEILFQEMLEWFAPEDKPFGAFPELLHLVEHGNRVIPIAQWVWCARYGGQLPNGWYAPLKDKPVLIPLLLLLVFLAVGEKGGKQEIREKVSAEKELLRITFTNGVGEIKALVAHPHRALQDHEKVDLPEELKQRELVQIIITSDFEEKTRRKRIMFSSETAEGVRKVCPVSVYQVPLSKLLRRSYAAGVDTLRKAFWENLMRAVILFDGARPRLTQQDRVKSL